ncbi:MAG: cell envelope integrity protein TolA [Legionella sp.]|nr:cell envelope integrity protein TolA [Legionella sp.]
MILNRTYQMALFAAVLLHVSLALAFMIHPKNTHPVMQREARQATQAPASSSDKPIEIVKAVTVNTKEVTAIVKQLKADRAAKEKAVQKQHQKLAAEASALKSRRIREQRKLDELRRENARAAKKSKEAAEAEKKRIKDVQKQKLIEVKKLDELKKEQLALKKQQSEEKARLDAENRARISGVVDKYKARILGAISQEWIVPDQVNTALSSRFKIQLAPNGTVLDVQLTRSSGDPVLDRSAQAAIYKASPLPVPGEPGLFNLFREISLTVKPEHVRG